MIALLAGYSLIASNIFAALVRYRIIVQLLSTSMHLYYDLYRVKE